MSPPQENKPIGTSILQLSVIDQDSSHNGQPFDFRILSGNEGGEFVLEKDGTLVANQVFRRDLATEYVILIQVESNCCLTSHMQSCCVTRSLNELFTTTAFSNSHHNVSILDKWKRSLMSNFAILL